MSLSFLIYLLIFFLLYEISLKGSSRWHKSYFFMLFFLVVWISCMLSFVNMTSYVNWLNASEMIFLTFYYVLGRFIKFQKIFKFFWHNRLKLTKIDTGDNLLLRQFTSVDIKWYQLTSIIVSQSHLTTIDVKWRQIRCFLTSLTFFKI